MEYAFRAANTLFSSPYVAQVKFEDKWLTASGSRSPANLSTLDVFLVDNVRMKVQVMQFEEGKCGLQSVETKEGGLVATKEGVRSTQSMDIVALKRCDIRFCDSAGAVVAEFHFDST